MKGFLVLLIGIAVAAGTANAGFIDSWELQNWTASGPATVTITPSSGPADSAVFSYTDYFAGYSGDTWVFSTVAPSGGEVSFDYDYSGFHAYFEVTAFLDVFAGSNIVNLVSAGPAVCCSAPSAGFDYSGSGSIQVNPGDTFGFMVGGGNSDSTNWLIGNLTITDFNAPTGTPEPTSFCLLLAGAAGLAFGALRRKRAN